MPETREEWQEHFDREYPDGAAVAFLDPDLDDETPNWDSPAGIVPRVMVLGAREGRPIVGLLAPEFPHHTIAWWQTDRPREGGGVLFDTSDGRRFLVVGVIPKAVAERNAELRKSGWQWADYDPEEHDDDWSWVA